MAAYHNAADDYAEAIIASKLAPDEVMNVMRRVPKSAYRLMENLTQIIVTQINKALAEGAIITQPMPPFLQGAFEAVRLDPNQVKNVLKGHNESVIKHIKTRAPWVVKGSTAHDQMILNMAKEYDVFDQNLLRAYQNGSLVKPFAVVPVGLTKSNKAIIDNIFTANPNATLVVDYGDAIVADGLGYNFLIRKNSLPDSVRHISFIGEKITSIKDSFLSNCPGLISVDLSGLSSLTSVGNLLLRNHNRELKSVDLRNVTELVKETIREGLSRQGYTGAIIK